MASNRQPPASQAPTDAIGGHNDDEQCANDDTPHDYLVCVTVHKASFAGLPNDDTYVSVKLSGQRQVRRTKTFSRSEMPVFNEYIVFEMRVSLAALLRRTVSLAAFRKTCCAKRDERFGEALIELHTLWMMDSTNGWLF